MNVPKVKCDLCGVEISKSNYSKHIRRHKNHPESFDIPEGKVNHDGLDCQFCGKECKNRNSLTQHELRCPKNSNRINVYIEGFNLNTNNVRRQAWNKGLTKDSDERLKERGIKFSKLHSGKDAPFYGKHHTPQTKEKLSIYRKEYLRKNPNMVPYVLNHSSKQSYPEKYFEEVFVNENIDLSYHLQVNKYELDFYNIEKMIDVEIDGEQHYVDCRIRKSDSERNEYLRSLGWTIIRIRWSRYQRLSKIQKQNLITALRQKIQNNPIQC